MSKDKIMKDLQRLLATQDFKDENEMNDFLKKYQNESIPEFPEEVLSEKEKAEDLVYEAYNLSKTKGIKLAQQSLEIDPDCILAYQYLGEHQNNPNNAKVYFKKGVEIGKKKFGGAFEKENAGHFWLIFETRPYMSCLSSLSQCEYLSGDVKKAIEILEFMLHLNPGDNQGVRYVLSTYLLESQRYDSFEKHIADHGEDGGIFFVYNKALYEYIRGKNSLKATHLLSKAIAHNPYVIKQLQSKTKKVSNSYSIGSKEEAQFYCEYNTKLWKETEGAIEWLKSIKSK